MEQRVLRESLQNLRSALQQDPQSLDPDSRDLLLKLHSDIETLLEQTEEVQPQQRAEVEEGLQGAIERFEGEHPTLTGMISHIAELLAGMGA